MTGCSITVTEVTWTPMNELTTLEADKSVAVAQSAIADERLPLETGGLLRTPPF
jgi:hypothetical protein